MHIPESLPSATYLRYSAPHMLGHHQQQNALENRSASKGCKEWKTLGGGVICKEKCVGVNGPLPKWESGCKQRIRKKIGKVLFTEVIQGNHILQLSCRSSTNLITEDKMCPISLQDMGRLLAHFFFQVKCMCTGHTLFSRCFLQAEFLERMHSRSLRMVQEKGQVQCGVRGGPGGSLGEGLDFQIFQFSSLCQGKRQVPEQRDLLFSSPFLCVCCLSLENY